jgi:hypothetical protein
VKINSTDCISTNLDEIGSFQPLQIINSTFYGNCITISNL